VTTPGAAAPLAAALRQADAAYAKGDWRTAEQACARALAEQAENFEALNLLGIICAQTQRTAQAEQLLRRALAVAPTDPVVHNNYGNVLKDLGRLRDAAANYERAIALDPDYAEACLNRGAVLRALGDRRGAIECYGRALALRPDNAGAHYDLGVILQESGRVDEALSSYARALAIQPGYAAAAYNQGVALQGQQRLEEALRSYTTAIQIQPGFAEAYNNRGNTLSELGQLEPALQDFARALHINPRLAEAYVNSGHALATLGKPVEAQASYARALAITPGWPWLRGAAVYARLQACAWTDLDAELAGLTTAIAAGDQAVAPFITLAISDSPTLLRQSVAIAGKEYAQPGRDLPAIARRPRRPRIRLGYFSADFHAHATANLLAGVIEGHDRSRFEVIGLSFGPDRRDATRERLERAFDRFVDVSRQADREVAQASRDLEIDIALDLKGFTRHARPGIFALRAAPIQVNYLGFPGTMGADFMDYIIADRVIIGEGDRRHYSEKIAYLPHSYQANDRQRAVAVEATTRASHGLPTEAFVFCCFNSPYKINPHTFDQWMRILKRVEGSVLWLLADNDVVAGNLRREAERRGISGARLVMAAPLALPEHLARHRVADLFLDTHPCGAHTTASDALWAGLPLLTRSGDSFASRVASSLLHAVGLPELVTSTTLEYEDAAVALATDSARLAALRERLDFNRLRTPLFDTEQYARDLERVYQAMYDRYHEGLGPADLDME
jgi:predicted O-linked N-acetylglucosamine transferase (SPINDLY family)